VFFPLHILVDDGHADHLKAAFTALYARNKDQCSGAVDTVRRVLARRSKMLSDLKTHVEEVTGGQICAKEERETQLAGIARARKNAAALKHPQYNKQQLLALSSRILADQGHGGTLAGQVTCRDVHDGKVAMWTGTYGKQIDEYVPGDFIKIDENLNVVSGEGFPNLATRFHLHVYRNRSDVECIVHSHPINVATLAQLGVPLFISHMDVMALFEVTTFLPAWPGVPFGDEEGEIIINALGGHSSALLAHHGLITTGRNIEEATYRAFFMEVAAEMQLKMMAANGGSIKGLPITDHKLSEIARDWRGSDGPVKAHFYAWARQTILKNKIEWL
jgi:L-fuculose-phosphate aldolase